MPRDPNQPRSAAERLEAAWRAGWTPDLGEPIGGHGLFVEALRTTYVSKPLGVLARIDYARLQVEQARPPVGFGPDTRVGRLRAPGGVLVDVAHQLAAALGQEGYAEGPDNDQPFGPWQGVANAAWCDSFAQWAAVLGGGYRWPAHCQFGERGDAYCPYTETHADELGLAAYPMFAPAGGLEPGYQILYSWGRNEWCDHIGTLVRVLDNGNLLVIEGNYQDRVALVERDWTYVRSIVALPAADVSNPDGPLGPPPHLKEDDVALSHITFPARKTVTVPIPPPQRSGGLPWAGVFFGICAGADDAPDDDDYPVRIQVNQADGVVRGVVGQAEDGFVHLTRRRFSIELGPGDESVTVYNKGGQTLVGQIEAAMVAA